MRTFKEESVRFAQSRRKSNASISLPMAIACVVAAIQHLAALCFQQRAEVRPIAANGGVDRYGRTVAHVTCNGKDANTAQVQAGLAWVFDRYVSDGWLYWAQEDARAARRGLWSDAQPVARWEWRRTSPPVGRRL